LKLNEIGTADFCVLMDGLEMCHTGAGKLEICRPFGIAYASNRLDE
jgi:hypothetical protein